MHEKFTNKCAESSSPAFRIQDGLQLQSELLCNYNPEAASCQDTASGFSYDGSRFCFLFKNQYNTNEFKVLIIQKKELAAAVDFG